MTYSQPRTPIIVTTSWDDGDPKDLRIADLLSSFGMTGTFYVPMRGYRGGPTLAHSQVRELSDNGFEIGGHTVSHVTLLGLHGDELRREVSNCKLILEQVTGRPVQMFCYPNGRYDSAVVEAVEQAGYLGARSTRMLKTAPRMDRFEMPTTLQAFPHRHITYVRNAVKGRNFGPLLRHITRIGSCPYWVEFGKSMFDYVLRHGGIWHIYGHSWELQDLQLWDGVTDLFAYVSKRLGVTYATNAQALRVALMMEQPAELAPATTLAQTKI